MKGAWLLLPLLVFSMATLAQKVSSLDQTEVLFAYRVKTVEEFMERFNNDSGSFIRKEYAKKNKEQVLTREKLVTGLLNFGDQALVADSVTAAFVTQISAQKNAYLLGFTDAGWYAETYCDFNLAGKTIEIPITFRVATDSEGRSKWMVAGIKDLPQLHATTSLKTIAPKHTRHFIATSSHATNFIELSNIFVPGLKPAYFFEKNLLNQQAVKGFTNLVNSGKLTFKYCNRIKYHFFQVDGWYFTVASFARPSLNAGWLIDSIQRVDENSRKQLLSTLLYNN